MERINAIMIHPTAQIAFAALDLLFIYWLYTM